VGDGDRLAGYEQALEPLGQDGAIRNLDLEIRRDQSGSEPFGFGLTLDVVIAVVDVDDVRPAPVTELIGESHCDATPDVAALASGDVDPVIVHPVTTPSTGDDRPRVILDVGDIDRAGEVVLEETWRPVLSERVPHHAVRAFGAVSECRSREGRDVSVTGRVDHDLAEQGDGPPARGGDDASDADAVGQCADREPVEQRFDAGIVSHLEQHPGFDVDVPLATGVVDAGVLLVDRSFEASREPDVAAVPVAVDTTVSASAAQTGIHVEEDRAHTFAGRGDRDGRPGGSSANDEDVGGAMDRNRTGHYRLSVVRSSPLRALGFADVNGSDVVLGGIV
jgi:hypothetical protein